MPDWQPVATQAHRFTAMGYGSIAKRIGKAPGASTGIICPNAL